ncbi:MAG: NERD domain-containing protein [Promethearchaeota archaeon]
MKGRIQRETEKALFIKFANGRELWIPKSVIQSQFISNSNKQQEFIIAQWFLKKKNIILMPTNPNIIGESGSEWYLKSQLLKKGIDGFENLREIQKFKQNFSRIITQSTEEEQEKLTCIIKELQKNETELIKQIRKKQEEYKYKLEQEKEQLLEGKLDLKEKKRLKEINKTLKKKLDKPFKKDFKQIKETEKEIKVRNKRLNKDVEKSVKPLHKAYSIIKSNEAFMLGAVGENATIKELKKLPSSYYIINEAILRFTRAIRWGKYNQYVKSCRIDHVVVGPTGIFLIETKNWNPQRILETRFTPHMQIDRASYIFFIHMMDFFNKKYPIYKIVATYRSLPQIPYKYVAQMTIRELVNYILQKPESIDQADVKVISKWLINRPIINNSHLVRYFGFRRPRYFRFKMF